MKRKTPTNRIFALLLLSLVLCPLLPAAQPDQLNGDAQRLTFLGNQLSADEAAINAINKALLQAGYHAAVANDKAANAAKGNELMDRKGGAPVPWQDFYGRTAKDFIQHDKHSPVYHQVDRPDQMNYIYRANNNQIDAAKAEIGAIGQKVDTLLARRRELEADQSSLWATLAFESIQNRDISTRQLYRNQLVATPSKTDDNRPDAGRIAAVEAAVKYIRALDYIVTQATDRLDANQESAYNLLRDTLLDQQRQLLASTATFAGTPGVDASEVDRIKDLVTQSKQIQSICKDISEANHKAQAADAAGEGEEQRKLLFRGTLQESLFAFAEAVAKIDDSLMTLATNWAVHGDPSKVHAYDPPTLVVSASPPTPAAAANPSPTMAHDDTPAPTPSATPQSDPASLFIGTWQVQYDDGYKGQTIHDPDNTIRGGGTWRLDGNQFIITYPSGMTSIWSLPIDPNGTTGTTTRRGQVVRFTAKKLASPTGNASASDPSTLFTGTWQIESDNGYKGQSIHDPDKTIRGGGTWKIEADQIIVTYPSGTTSVWNLPILPTGSTGTTFRRGQAIKFTARKLSSPTNTANP